MHHKDRTPPQYNKDQKKEPDQLVQSTSLTQKTIAKDNPRLRKQIGDHPKARREQCNIPASSTSGSEVSASSSENEVSGRNREKMVSKVTRPHNRASIGTRNWTFLTN